MSAQLVIGQHGCDGLVLKESRAPARLDQLTQLAVQGLLFVDLPPCSAPFLPVHKRYAVINNVINSNNNSPIKCTVYTSISTNVLLRL